MNGNERREVIRSFSKEDRGRFFNAIAKRLRTFLVVLIILMLASMTTLVSVLLSYPALLQKHVIIIIIGFSVLLTLLTVMAIFVWMRRVSDEEIEKILKAPKESSEGADRQQMTALETEIDQEYIVAMLPAAVNGSKWFAQLGNMRWHAWRIPKLLSLPHKKRLGYLKRLMLEQKVLSLPNVVISWIACPIMTVFVVGTAMWSAAQGYGLMSLWRWLVLTVILLLFASVMTCIIIWCVKGVTSQYTEENRLIRRMMEYIESLPKDSGE